MIQFIGKFIQNKWDIKNELKIATSIWNEFKCEQESVETPGVSTLLRRNCLFSANYITKGVLKRHHLTVSALIKRPSLCQPNPNQSHDQCEVWFIRNAVCCTGRTTFSLPAVCCGEAAIKWTAHKYLHFTWFKEHCLGPTLLVLFLLISRESVHWLFLFFNPFPLLIVLFPQFGAFLVLVCACCNISFRNRMNCLFSAANANLASLALLCQIFAIWSLYLLPGKKILMFCLFDRFYVHRNLV